MNLQPYAIINSETHIVENAVLWDGNTETWHPPAGFYAVALEDINAGIGWKYENGEFVDVRPVAEPEA